MKLFLLVTLLGTALASPGGFSYGYSTAYGPLARHALAYGGFAAAPAGYAHYGSAVAAAPVAYHAGAVHGYAAAAPAVATYAAATPAVATYAAAAPAVATYAAAAPAVATYSAPAAAVVPVTRVSAQPAVVQNVVDVAQPKLATRRYEIRRPAIQKQFYDVEERVVVRPAGSAVVELDTPIGANQRGPTQVRPAAPPVALQAYTSTHLGHHVLHAAPIAVPTIPHHPAVVEQSQEIPQQVEQVSQIQQQPIPQQPISQQPSQQQQQFDDSDSVSVDNPEFSVRTQAPQNLPSPLFRSQLSEFSRSEASQFNQYSRGPQPQPQQFQSSEGLPSFSRSRVTEYLQPEALPPQQVRSQPAPARQQEAISFARSQLPSVSPTPEVSPRLGPTPQPLQEPELESRSFGAEVIPSARNLSPEQSQANQARLIELLTARGPVSEVRSASEPIRGRVLSATPAPPGAEPADERVNTRRIVVNRPIQTVQEVDVVEPFTKLERVAVHQPAVVKTAHLEYAAVPAVHTAVHAVHAPVHAVHTAVPAAVTVAPHYYKK